MGGNGWQVWMPGQYYTKDSSTKFTFVVVTGHWKSVGFAGFSVPGRLPQPDLALRVEIVMRFLKSLASIGACPRYVVDSLAVPTLEDGGSTRTNATATPTLFGPSSEASEATTIAEQKEDQVPSKPGGEAVKVEPTTPAEGSVAITVGQRSPKSDQS